MTTSANPTSSVCLLYCTEDGQDWSDYVAKELQGGFQLSVVCVEMGASGRLTQGGRQIQDRAQPPGSVLIVIASPKFLRTMIAFPWMHFGTLIPHQSLSLGQSGVDTGPIPAVLFLCGTTSSDFDEYKLSERFLGLDRWTTVGHEQSERLWTEVVRLVESCKATVEEQTEQGKRMTRAATGSDGKGTGPKMVRQKLDFQMVPSEVKCEEPTMVVVSFDHAVTDSEADLKRGVEILFEGDTLPTKISVCWLNAHTVYFYAPPHPAGKATVRIFFRGRDIGSRPLIYHSTMLDATVGIVQILLHQLSTLCHKLVVEKRLPDVGALDRMLSDVFQIDSPPIVVPTVVYEKFFEIYRMQTLDTSSVQLPTPIHLAAKYGLNELASKMIDLPEARYALSITNIDGQYPEELARAAGHSQLGTTFQNLREEDEAERDIKNIRVDVVHDDVTDDVSGGDDQEQDDDMYVSPSEDGGFAEIYAAFVNSSGQEADSEELYFDMTGNTKARITRDESIGDADYVTPDQNDDASGSDYEEVKYPGRLFKHPMLPLKPPTETDDEAEGDVTKTPIKTIPNRPAVVQRRIPEIATKWDAAGLQQPPTGQAGLPLEQKTVTADSTTSIVSDGSGAEQELLSILLRVRNNEMDMAQAELLFQEWRKHHQNGMTSSFKHKQQQLERIREESKAAEDPSRIASILNMFGFGNSTKKTARLKAKQSGTLAAGGRTSSPASARGGLGLPTVSTTNQQSSRSSTTSSSSRDSVTSRASTTSGIEVDLAISNRFGDDAPNEFLPTPQVPSRKPPALNSKLPASLPATHTAENSAQEIYLQVIPDSPTYDERLPSMAAPPPASASSRNGHFSPPLVMQRTMPEAPNPPLYDPSKTHRKQSLPAPPPYVPARVSSPRFDGSGNSYTPAGRRSPAPPPPVGPRRTQLVQSQVDAEEQSSPTMDRKRPAVAPRAK